MANGDLDRDEKIAIALISLALACLFSIIANR